MADSQSSKLCEEEIRLSAAKSRETPWQKWGTYLPERQWGTVREDYSDNGDCWNYFPWEMAQYRAYRWGEDGLLGWTDNGCRLCFSTSLWNGNDSMLKERLFGLSNAQGNHGEDVKELYYYLDATPTHSYAKALYKYPHRAFPYTELREQNKQRGSTDREFELLDTGIFDDDRYFDVQIEYAKASPEDMFIRITVSNRGSEPATVTVLPTLTFRNDWTYPIDSSNTPTKPSLNKGTVGEIRAWHDTLGCYALLPVDMLDDPGSLKTIFTDNETNETRLGPDFANTVSAYKKDAFDRYVVHADQSSVNPRECGTKAAFVCSLSLEPQAEKVLIFRLLRIDAESTVIQPVNASACFAERIIEANEFYSKRVPSAASDDEKNISRQAFAGLLWSKQFYYYIGEDWTNRSDRDALRPQSNGRNRDWGHLYCRDIISMPDKWEYPWFAAWDLAFHMVPMATIDPAFAKSQLLLLLREWYLHPNGQMPAYEFNFSDVNPPVHAWAVWHVYRATATEPHECDLDFLERAFQKLMLNFTWWVNRNDSNGKNLFGGGFLGLDNIGVFDRSQLPQGIGLDQADATAWMGLYCSCMLQMSIELAQTRPAYEDIASKFFEHYISVIHATNTLDGTGLWDDEEGFYFDRMTGEDAKPRVLRVRSLVGLIPLSGICIVRKESLEKLTGLKKRSIWFRDHRPELASLVGEVKTDEPLFRGALCLSLVPRDRLIRILKRVLDETEFLSEFGIRSISKFHEQHPFVMDYGGESYRVEYAPGEGISSIFGGNSNWRGPVWLPTNALFCLALDQYHLMYGDSLCIECPTGSGHLMTFADIAREVSRRLCAIFLRNESGHRPCHDGEPRYARNLHWRKLLLFNEYFSGDTGRGIGASHQTGWTALIATAIQWRYADSDKRLQLL